MPDSSADIRPSPTQVRICFTRPGKGTSVYAEGLVDDDGRRLRTLTAPPAAVCLSLSERFRRRGWIAAGQSIGSIAKYLFYDEYFTVVEFRDPAGELLGYYCDIATPLQKAEGEYLVTDLLLDLWIAPDLGLGVRVLDVDEFEAAASAGLLSPALQAQARVTLARLQAEIAEGVFPGPYLR